MIENETVSVESECLRLDVFLNRRYPSSSRAFIREAIAGGDVTVIRGDRDCRVLKGEKLRPGERVRIRRLLEKADNLVRPDDNADKGIASPIFEDANLLAFDKPAGMPVQPLNCFESGTLMNAVAARFPECRALGGELEANGDSPLMAGAIHRIDADTSGLVLVARDIGSYLNLRDQFAEQSVRKTYLALVEGAVSVGGTLENDLIHDPTLPFCRMIDARHNRLTRSQQAKCRPLRAVTRFQPIGRTTCENEERTLLEVTIFTGVTHQIRAQLAMAGMHIINDRLYGAFAIENQVGHCLHSLSAAFRHPASGLPTEIRTARPTWSQIAG